jgi:hypothetical protein
LLIVIATRDDAMPAIPRQPVTVSSDAAGPSVDAGTRSSIT